MMAKVRNLFMSVRHSNAEKDVTDMTDVLKKHLSVAQHNVEILEKIYSETRQGHVGTGPPEGRRKTSHLPKGNFKEAPLMNEPHEQHEPMETDEINKPPERRSEMKDEMEAVNKAKNSLKKCQDEVENYKRNRQDKTRLGESSSAKKRKVAIQLYCAQKTDLTDFAMRELETKLISEHGMKLTIQTCKTLSSIQSCTPLIVICLASSHLGIDFSNAVYGVPTGSNTAVLIFHHRKPHALPTQPSNAALTEDEFKNVGIIIDVAFFEDMGLHDCDMNTNGYKTLITFIAGHCEK